MSIFTGIIFLDVFGIIVALIFVLYSYILWIYQTWKRKNVPYFKPIFLFGNKQPSKEGVSLGEDVFKIVEKAQKKGWSYFGLFLSASPFFVPLDLDIVKLILTKDFDHFTDRGIYYNEKDDPLSAHLFAIGGIKWRNLRTKLTPTFTSGKMKGMFQTVSHCGELLESHLQQFDRSKPIDIKHYLACYSTDIIGSCAFGLECNSFNDPDSPFIKYGKKIFVSRSLKRIISIFANSFPGLARVFHLKTVSADVASFFSEIVTKTVKYRLQNSMTRNDFLQILIDITNKNNGGPNEDVSAGDGTTLTMNEVIAQCFVFFLAGFETSSTTMSFALYELATHPDIQENVREELLRVLKKHDNKISYDLLKELEYMQQVIEETLRKYPPVPFITRKCVEDYKIPNINITLDKGTKVIIPIKNIHYDSEIYNNPTQFDPERFSKEIKNKRNPYSHIPFGEGPRICIGMRFGIMQSKVGLASILKNFRVTLNPKTKTPLVMDPKSFIPSTKGGIWLNLEKI